MKIYCLTKKEKEVYMKQKQSVLQNKQKQTARSPWTAYFGQLSPRLREKAANSLFGTTYAKLKQSLLGK